MKRCIKRCYHTFNYTNAWLWWQKGLVRFFFMRKTKEAKANTLVSHKGLAHSILKNYRVSLKKTEKKTAHAEIWLHTAIFDQRVAIYKRVKTTDPTFLHPRFFIRKNAKSIQQMSANRKGLIGFSIKNDGRISKQWF